MVVFLSGNDYSHIAVLIECPSCRKELAVGKEKLSSLPRNLALENIVIRYTEERSRSIRKSLR